MMFRSAAFVLLPMIAACVESADEPAPAPAALVAAAEVPREPGHLSEVLVDEIVIRATPERVYEIVADLPRYQDWNPWVTKADGAFVPGTEVYVDVILGTRVQKSTHVVLTAVPHRELCWRDGGWNAWFVYGQRCRTIVDLGDGTVLYTNELLLDGVLAWLARLATGADLEAGMAAENAALKARAEG